MKIKFQRTGGFANIPVNIEVDTQAVTGAVAEELTTLLGKVTFNKEKLAAVPDVCNYELHVESDGQEQLLTTNDMEMSEEASSLFECLMRNFWG
jgi:hypothetical protein